MSKETKKLSKKRNRAWLAYAKNKCNRLYAVYKSARNAVVINIRKDKAQYQKSLVRKMKRSPKMFYSYIRSKQRNAVYVTTVRNTAGRLSSNDTETSQILCDQFQQVYANQDYVDLFKSCSKFSWWSVCWGSIYWGYSLQEFVHTKCFKVTRTRQYTSSFVKKLCWSACCSINVYFSGQFFTWYLEISYCDSSV